MSEAQVVVVTSALSGVTNTLVALLDHVVSGGSFGDTIDELTHRHIGMLDDLEGSLGTTRASSEEVRGDIGTHLQALRQRCQAIQVLTEASPRVRDEVLVCGEKLAARILAWTLNAIDVPATAVDADTFLETDDAHQEANPLRGLYERSTRRTLESRLRDRITPVVTGYCGVSPHGHTTTLGRGGSDFSATLIGAALDARRVVIWTDVDGVYSADPRIESKARVIRHLHYREAAELSYYGAKVLHPRTIEPVANRAIPVEIRDSARPHLAGTCVDNRMTPGSHPVKAISAVVGHVLVAVEGRGMAGVPGVAARLFGALAAHDISVTMISQSSSEASICVAIPSSDKAKAETALKDAFRMDIARGHIDDISVRPSVGLIAAVGLGMAQTPGIAGRVCQSLGRAGVNVLAIAQGSSELNITLAVDERDVPSAIKSIHQSFGLEREDTGVETENGVDLAILGWGNVGRTLGDLIIQRSDAVRERFGLALRIVAISDSTGYLFAPRGLDQDALTGASQAKREGRGLATVPAARATTDSARVVREVLAYRYAYPVIIDASASSGMHDAYLAAFAGGADVVTANKWPLAGALEALQTLLRRATGAGRMLRAEATVGAGLPVLDTVDMLSATGDRVISIEGCLSGTLAHVFWRMEQGASFSDAVKEAWDLGYTEPDPVLDLSGVDVARKAKIIGRLSGVTAGDLDVEVQGLVPGVPTGLSPDEIMHELRNLDAEIAEQLANAAAAQRVLRYVARVHSDGIRVGPVAVPLTSPLGGLQGTDNMIVIHSERYRDRPLCVTGPGAGVDVTAMGMLSDILRIVAERRNP